MAHSEHEEWLADEQARKAVHEKHHAPARTFDVG
jgi:hypothetical protein